MSAVSKLLGRKGKPGKATAIYRGYAADSVAATSKAFTGFPIGKQTQDRLVVVVAFTAASNGDITGVTVNGMKATQLVGRPEVGSYDLAIFAVRVPQGSTADVVVSSSVSCSKWGVVVYTVSGQRKDAPVDIAYGNASYVAGVSSSIDLSAGGVLLAAAYGQRNGSVTWTGPTEIFDVQPFSEGTFSAAMLDTIPASVVDSALAISGMNSTNATQVLVAACFR